MQDKVHKRRYKYRPKIKEMDKAIIRASITRELKSEIDNWLATEPTLKIGYDYETQAIEAGIRFARQLIEKSQGKMPKSRNQKKIQDMFGQH